MHQSLATGRDCIHALFVFLRGLVRLSNGWIQFAKFSGIGISWVLTTGVYLYLGYTAGNWVDARLGTPPVFLLVGALLAVLLSLWTLFNDVRALTKIPGDYGTRTERTTKRDRKDPPRVE